MSKDELTYDLQKAFTIVEVLVAMAIIMMVAIAASVMISSSSRASTQTKILDRQQVVAKSVLKRAISDTSWIKEFDCEKVVTPAVPCEAAIDGYAPDGDPILKENNDTIKHQIKFEATAIKIPGANGANDDPTQPDVYRIKVTNTILAPESVGVFKPYSVTGTLNISVRANTGVLRLRTCSITPQIDERLGTGMCSSDSAETYTLKEPADCTGRNTKLYCESWNTVKNDPKYTQVTVAPLPNVKFELVGPLPHSGDKKQEIITDSDGMINVTLEPGQYRLDQPSVGGSTTKWALWASHSMPAQGYVDVVASETREASQIFYPNLNGDVTLNLRQEDISNPVSPQVKNEAARDVAVRLVPVPEGRAVLASGVKDGWTTAKSGAGSVTIRDVKPGLYSAYLLNFPGTFATPLTRSANYVWIEPSASTNAPVVLPEGLVLTQTACNSAIRQSLIAGGMMVDQCPVLEASEGDSSIGTAGT